MVEFALASSLLIPIFLGTFQFRYTFYVYNLLSTHMRAGARFASMKAFKCADDTSVSNYKQKVRNVVRYGKPSPTNTDTVIEPGLTNEQVSVSIKDASGTEVTSANASTRTPSYVEVSTATYNVNALFTTYTFTNKPLVRMPYLGAYQTTLTEPAP
jgi:Flp pilus assembly protein TadG